MLKKKANFEAINDNWAKTLLQEITIIAISCISLRPL